MLEQMDCYSEPLLECYCASPSPPSENNDDSTRTTQIHTKTLPDYPPKPNPFGPIVGNMKHVFSCKYNKNFKGKLFIASKAVCFRRTKILSPWKMATVIIPWDSVVEIYAEIDGGGHEMIAIKTGDDLMHELEHFDVDILVVRNALSSIWKECKDKQHDERNHGAVQQFYRRICLFFESSYCGTEVRDEEVSNRTLHVNLRKGDFDVETVWSELYNSDDEMFTEKVIEEMKLAMTLDEFFHQFLSDDAPASLVSHHRATGDFDVKTTEWEDTDNISKTRCISYSHPISTKISMAPAAGKATKSQVMQRFGDHGICIDSEIRTNDVPLADCFYIVDRLIVASNEEGGISLTIKFGTIFVKKTMFKSVINAASVNDVTEFHRGFVAFVRHNIS